VVHTDNSKLRPVCPSSSQATIACCCTLDSSLSWPFNHRPYPFPIQWILIWPSHTISRLGKKEIYHPRQWTTICGSSLLEAHLPLSRTRVLRLSTASVLPGIKIYFPYQIRQRFEAWNGYHCSVRSCFWTIRILGPDTSITE